MEHERKKKKAADGPKLITEQYNTINDKCNREI
jgi:hypothetical protein